MKKKEKTKVIIAMSGGIDSSVAAALLKKEGYEVIGVFMKFWSERGKNKPENSCCTLESEKRARAVAKILKIPFYVFNFEKEFKKRVVDYFLAEYKSGRTPNPCVVCNKEIKFGLLLEKALTLEADYVATGHYAQIKSTNKKFVNSKQIRYSLMKGKDDEKDQSYFLWRLSQKQLNHILFPVGNYAKTKIRKLAKKFKLPVLNIPESQEICFVPSGINDFLTRYLKQESGKIIDGKGKILGTHNGLAFYTIGQRKGINLPGGPYYVLDKDLKNNFLIVTKNERNLYKKELVVVNANWVLGKEPKLPLSVKVKIRYKSVPATAKIYKITAVHAQQNTRYKIQLNRSQRAITPGQSAVFYLPADRQGKAQELLGGGIINYPCGTNSCG